MKKVIIIGAGPAGITAGYELLKQSKEYEVTILEESPYIGGISRTEVYNGHRMDIGGHRFFSKSQEVNDWWEEIMPMQGAPAYDDDKLNRDVPLVKDGPDPARVDRVMLNRNRISHIYYNRKFFEYPVRMNADTIKNMGFGTTMQAGFSYLGSLVAKKPESTLENFYINQFGKKLYSMFFEGYTEKLWGRHPREIDPSWGAQRTKGLSITEIVKDATRKVFHKESKDVNTSLISAFKYPKLGPGQLWEVAAEEFEKMGGSIHMNCQVIRINTDGNKVESVTCAVDGITIEEKADIVISSMPIKDLIIGMNNVPPNVTEIARRLPYRDFVTVGLLVPKLRINNTTYMRTLGNVIPDTWIYVQDTGVKMGRIQIFNNWSPYLLQNPEKTVWLGLEYFCNEGDRYWNMTDEEWVELATKELVQMGILSESTKVLDFHKVAVKKAYPAYFDSYSRFDEVRTYLDGFENLYCVGRNGQHRYNNMDHSMITSFETVKNILSGEKDKSNIWNVNTEQEYHEEKAGKEEGKVAESEKKTTATATPVPPVKEQNVNAPSGETGLGAQADTAVTEKKEEEITASVQTVPTPPVRRPIRRASKKEQAVVQETVEEVTPAVSEEPVQAVETMDVSPVEVTVPVVAEVVIPEAEIHVSKSRSIWDDVAMAEAAAPVKTAPIKVKATVEEKPVAEEKEKLPVEETVKEEEAVEEVKEEASVVEEIKAEEKPAEPKKSGRGRKKKTVTEAPEVAKIEEKEEEKPEVAEIEEKPAEPKKSSRGRKKKVVTQTVTAEAAEEEKKPEETVEAAEEEKKPEEKVEAAKEEKKPEETVEAAEEEKKPEEKAEAAKEEKKPEEIVEEATEQAVEDKAEEATAKEAEEVKKDKPAENKKASGNRRKKPVAKEETVKEPEAEAAVKEKSAPSRSAAGKTIAGRGSSRRVSDGRQNTSRRKVETEKKAVSNVGKEATVGNMKGTVIKSNVIQKTTEESTKGSSERGRK